MWVLPRRAEGGGTCHVHGRVTTAAGEPLAGVTVRFSSGLPAQVTDRQGRYAVEAPSEPAECAVVPAKDGYRFIPAERRVWLSGADVQASFTAEAIASDKDQWLWHRGWWWAEELIVDGPAKRGRIDFWRPENWFYFDVYSAGTYTVETFKGSLDDTFVTLYNERLRFVDDDDNSGGGRMSKIVANLVPGTYYVVVEGYSWWDTGDYTIRVTSAGPTVTWFAINNGAGSTSSRTVTLNNTCSGDPTEYMASESPNFTDAAWQPYSTAPTFELSAGNDTKRVYFKVRNAERSSGAASDTVELNEPVIVELVVNGPTKGGYIWPKGDADWFAFTAASADTYTVTTWAGTLTDNFMELYGDDQATLLASDDNSGESRKMARIVRALAPGTYYVKVRAASSKKTGTYTIRVTTGEPAISILDPHGDPMANAWAEVGNSEVVFNAKTPAVLEVVCRFAVNAPGVPDIANKVRACISPVGSSTLQWQTLKKAPSPWLGSPAGRPAGGHTTMGKAVLDTKTGRYEVKAVFTGLPASNADFGPKAIWAQIVDGATVLAEAQQPIEVFYPRLASNNPGTGRDRGPNWFFFWKTGNVCGTTTGWEYLSGWSYGSYTPGDDHVHVKDAAPTINSGPETYWNDLGESVTVTGQGVGPLCCAETLAHEFQHKWFYETWAPLIAAAEADGEEGGDDFDDPDDDGIPNIFENGFLGIATDPSDPDTFNMGWPYTWYGDEELRCRKAELDPGLAVDEAADWAFPGSNSYPRYRGQ